MKAVLDTKPTSIYDDDTSQHYHFPRRYRAIVGRALGDWVVLRRPRADGGNLAYFAAAKIVSIDDDPNTPGMSYARFADYLPFDSPVPWRVDGSYAEEPLRNMPQREVGVYLRGRSVRPLTDEDFADIVLSGLRQSLDTSKILTLGLMSPGETADDLGDPLGERTRQVEQVLTNRVVRDANFRRSVCGAYDHRCAVTRIKVMDSAGNYGIHAAHIWGVSQGGPDVVSNGIALSATVHWLFDSYLIAVTDDYRLLIDHMRVPADVREILLRHGDHIALPSDRKDWPHPVYLSKHRHIFLGITKA